MSNDPELKAMSEVFDALQGLDRGTQKRVVEWVMTKLGDSAGSTGAKRGRKPGAKAASKTGAKRGRKPGRPAGKKAGAKRGRKPGVKAAATASTGAKRGPKPGAKRGRKPGRPAGKKAAAKSGAGRRGRPRKNADSGMQTSNA